MEDLLPLAESIVVGALGDDQAEECRLIGGLAVRLLTDEHARVTRDVDLVAMTDSARERLLDHLRCTGYQVGESGGWWRAVKPGDGGGVIDISQHPIVNPRTFETFALHGEPSRQNGASSRLLVAAATDLVSLKLAAGRDQDVVDVFLLISRCGPRAADVARAAEADDVERSVSTGAFRIRQALESGTLAELVKLILSRNVNSDEEQALRSFLDELHAEGI